MCIRLIMTYRSQVWYMKAAKPYRKKTSNDTEQELTNNLQSA